MSYVYLGYGITLGLLAAYAFRVAWRGRALRKVVPSEVVRSEVILSEVVLSDPDRRP